jgi:hypothetical protein
MVVVAAVVDVERVVGTVLEADVVGIGVDVVAIRTLSTTLPSVTEGTVALNVLWRTTPADGVELVTVEFDDFITDESVTLSVERSGTRYESPVLLTATTAAGVVDTVEVRLCPGLLPLGAALLVSSNAGP